MAFLDETGVTQLASDIKNLADAAYLPKMVEMELDTSEILAGYVTEAIGRVVTFRSSTKSVTIPRIIAVAKGAAYSVAVTYGSTVAATTRRSWSIVNDIGICLQVINHYAAAGTTVTTEFTSDYDGYLWLTVDVNYTNIIITGPEVLSDIAALQINSAIPKGPALTSSLTDQIFKYECENLMSMVDVSVGNERSMTLYHNRMEMHFTSPTPTGSTFYSFLISNTPRHVGSTHTSVVSNLEESDFVDIHIPDNYDLYFTRSLSGTSTLTGQAAGGFIVATRNPTTGEITAYSGAGSTVTKNSYHGYTIIDNVTERLPAIRANRNIAVLFQTRHPTVEQIWTCALDMEKRGFGYLGMTGDPENNEVASRAYESGDYLTMHDKLYKVTTPITSGGAIIADTNVEQTTLANELKTGGGGYVIKAPVIVNESSGPLAAFTDGADSMPVQNLVVSIDPVQERNLFDSSTTIEDGYYNNNGVLQSSSDTRHTTTYIPVKPDTFYTLSGTIKSSTSATTGVYFWDSSKQWISRAVNTPMPPLTVLTPSNCAYVTLQVASVAKGFQANTIQFEIGTEATSYKSYSAVCPITGRTGTTISYGENLFDTVSFTDGSYISSAGNIVASSAFAYSDYIPVNSGDLLYIRLKSTYGGQVRIHGYTDGKEWIEQIISYGSTQNSNVDNSVEIPSTASYIRISCVNESNRAYGYASIVRTEDVSWQTEVGSIYGGTVDPAAGTLTEEWANIASYNGETLPGEWISDRDIYEEGTTPTTGAQVVYKLASPVTHQISCHRIDTSLGSNVIFADSGRVVKCRYPADTKLYIDNKIAEMMS